MLKSLVIITSLLISCLTLAEPAPPAAATVCVACHGAAGISSNELWPNIAGQKKDYLIKQLTAFQSGERKDPMMSPIAANLSKEDIVAVATYFSKIAH